MTKKKNKPEAITRLRKNKCSNRELLTEISSLASENNRLRQELRATSLQMNEQERQVDQLSSQNT